jgi:hypothetical protein
MPSGYYDSKEYKSSVDSRGSEAHETTNKHRIIKPAYFKNKAHARGYEIALVLACKKPPYKHEQRMGDIVLVTSPPVTMNTAECVDVIKFNGPEEIQLDLTVKEPEKSARDAMLYVPYFFDPGKVTIKQMKKKRKMWYLEIKN